MLKSTHDLSLLHHRRYDARSYKVSPTVIRVIGEVVDTKPPGMYVPDDPDPLVIHHMHVAIDVSIESMEIVDAEVSFEMNPSLECPTIIEHYQKLVGLSISRGFSRRLRELFGGPRACTHTTALIQAMAPVVVQSIWSLHMSNRTDDLGPGGDNRDPESMLLTNLNTCHLWAEDGDKVARVRAGDQGTVPVWIDKRYRELGRDPQEWRSPIPGL